jgi:hypothetical protein
MKKNLIYSLFVLITLALTLSACSSAKKIEAKPASNFKPMGVVASYDRVMFIDKPETVAFIGFNRLIVSASDGTLLSCLAVPGKINVTGNGSKYLIVDLLTAPAEAQIMVIKCPDACPVQVHFVPETIIK